MQREVTTHKQAAAGKKIIIALGLIFAVVGGIMLKPLLITPLSLTKDAQNWDAIEATVVSSKVRSHSSDDGTTYSVYIAYRYEISGEEYLGDRYNFMGGSSSGYDGKSKVVNQHPKGHVFTVYVNPKNPGQSVIRRDYSASLLIGLMPLIFMLVGIGVLIGGLLPKKIKLDDAQAGEQIVTLKGKSRIGNVIGISIFAVTWNGAVVFLLMVDAPILFKVIFGLVGLGVIAGVVHSVLACFNPRPIVEITPGNIKPGTNGALRWGFEGQTDRIRSLKITLQCVHITSETRRSGSETRTKVIKTPTFSNELFSNTKHNEIVRGAVNFQIPENQPASRRGSTDGVLWVLKFEGDIPKWPDIKEEFTFLVYPAE